MIEKEDYLFDITMKSFNEMLNPERLFTLLIEKRFEQFGITLTLEQKKHIVKQFSSEKLDSLSLELTDQQEEILIKANVDLATFSDIKDTIAELEKELPESIKKAQEEVIELISSEMLKSWLNQLHGELDIIGKHNNNFKEILNKQWGEILNLLEALLNISLQIGSDFNSTFRPQAVAENDLVFEILTFTHARCCQIGEEILILLKEGLSDGAHARWRSLHELVTIAKFIVQNDDRDLANRYLLHQDITKYKRAKKYQKYHEELSYEPISQEEFLQLENRYKFLLNEFGDEYKYDYGWAAHCLDDKRPNFIKIEKFVGLDFMRPFYSLANINIHGGSEGLFYRLGTIPDNSGFLLAGRSVYGLGEPTQNTAYTIANITALLLTHKINLDRLTLIQTFTKLTNIIFEKVDDYMKNEIID